MVLIQSRHGQCSWRQSVFNSFWLWTPRVGKVPSVIWVHVCSLLYHVRTAQPNYPLQLTIASKLGTNQRRNTTQIKCCANILLATNFHTVRQMVAKDHAQRIRSILAIT